MQYSTIPIYTLTTLKEKNFRYPVDEISHSGKAVAAFQEYLKDRPSEYLSIILADGKNKMIGIADVCIGDLSRMNVSIRSVMTHVIVGRAHSYFLGHNHPSGDTNPSVDDIDFTKKVQEASKIIGCHMNDHIIVSSGINESYYSFYEDGML